MIKYPIVLYCFVYIFLLRFAFHRMFLRAKVCAYFQSAKQWGTAGKNRETEGNAVIFLTIL